MQPASLNYSPADRAAEKEQARAKDAYALASGIRSAAQIKSQNQFVALPKGSARLKLDASRSLI